MINRALRAVLGDDLSDFESLLQNNKDICSHHKNIQSLMIEMLTPTNMVLCFKRKISLITAVIFKNFWQKEKRTVHYRLERHSHQSPQLWYLLPESIKEVVSLEIVEREVKHWICDDCPCRLCEPYVNYFCCYP